MATPRLPHVVAFLIGLASLHAAALDMRSQIEADWRLQESVLSTSLEVTTQGDAAGGCDGIKDGAWGFHTDCVANPWWQVDLGAVTPVARVVVWNRCDMADRAARLSVLASDDGTAWRTVYTHDGTVFYGAKNGPPLTASLEGVATRYIRVQVPDTTYLHLDEVEVFGPDAPETNLALKRPADEVKTSQWSTNHLEMQPADWDKRTRALAAYADRLLAEVGEGGRDVRDEAERLRAFQAQLAMLPPGQCTEREGICAHELVRSLLLKHPAIDFDTLLFVKRVPGSFSHMSDQYYGWWSRPGGGLFLLRDFAGDSPSVTCVTGGFREEGSFLRPSLSYDGTRVLFAWCRYYPNLAADQNKLDKSHLPEDAFYHVFEMNLQGAGLRQLTSGKYDDFDARYLPDGRIVFLSTRRGQSLQCGPDSARRSMRDAALPDSYVRCGGGPERPVAVYTLHTMDADGKNVCAISPFEMFEWTPSVADDGTILYSRWDYIDRSNMPYMSLWSMHPDGTQARLVYKNYTIAPHCTFEPQCVPGSHKVVFTGSGHHAQTMGSLALLDPTQGTEGTTPIQRLTPEVRFPEIEAWSGNYYTSPWPLSERFYLVAWGCETQIAQGTLRPPNGMGIYLFDAENNHKELLYRDPEIGSECPLPLRARPKPPVLASSVQWDEEHAGRFLVTDVYRGLKNTQRGSVKALRIVAVPPKTHPTMNLPNMGLTNDDPGKCVLGTVPVEEDGSAYFMVPASLIVFFQALDAQGMAIQTMRSATYAQPGQTVSCVGCHEPRMQTPPAQRALAMRRPPSKIAPGPEGTWPMRFDRLVQPALDRLCVQCHQPGAPGSRIDLTPDKAYAALADFGSPSLRASVAAAYQRGYSMDGADGARAGALWAAMDNRAVHPDLALDDDARERLAIWLDLYGQRLGSFSEEQEQQLRDLRAQSAAILDEQG